MRRTCPAASAVVALRMLEAARSSGVPLGEAELSAAVVAVMPKSPADSWAEAMLLVRTAGDDLAKHPAAVTSMLRSFRIGSQWMKTNVPWEAGVEVYTLALRTGMQPRDMPSHAASLVIRCLCRGGFAAAAASAYDDMAASGRFRRYESMMRANVCLSLTRYVSEWATAMRMLQQQLWHRDPLLKVTVGSCIKGLERENASWNTAAALLGCVCEQPALYDTFTQASKAVANGEHRGRKLAYDSDSVTLVARLFRVMHKDAPARALAMAHALAKQHRHMATPVVGQAVLHGAAWSSLDRRSLFEPFRIDPSVAPAPPRATQHSAASEESRDAEAAIVQQQAQAGEWRSALRRLLGTVNSMSIAAEHRCRQAVLASAGHVRWEVAALVHQTMCAARGTPPGLNEVTLLVESARKQNAWRGALAVMNAADATGVQIAPGAYVHTLDAMPPWRVALQLAAVALPKVDGVTQRVITSRAAALALRQGATTHGVRIVGGMVQDGVVPGAALLDLLDDDTFRRVSARGLVPAPEAGALLRRQHSWVRAAQLASVILSDARERLREPVHGGLASWSLDSGDMRNNAAQQSITAEAFLSMRRAGAWDAAVAVVAQHVDAAGNLAPHLAVPAALSCAVACAAHEGRHSDAAQLLEVMKRAGAVFTASYLTTLLKTARPDDQSEVNAAAAAEMLTERDASDRRTLQALSNNGRAPMLARRSLDAFDKLAKHPDWLRPVDVESAVLRSKTLLGAQEGWIRALECCRVGTRRRVMRGEAVQLFLREYPDQWQVAVAAWGSNVQYKPLLYNELLVRAGL